MNEKQLRKSKDKIENEMEELEEKLSEKRNELEKIERKEKEKKNKEYIGRYYKIYKQFCKDRWWEYHKIVGVDGIHYITIMFYEWLGRIEIDKKHIVEWLDNEKRITEKEFKEKFIEALSNIIGKEYKLERVN